MNDSRTDTYTEYVVACEDGATYRHYVKDPKNAMNTYYRSIHVDRDEDCGPHHVVKRRVTVEYSYGEWADVGDDELPSAGRNELHLESQRYRCPKCPAEVGERCLNLSLLKKGQKKFTSWPHMERFPEVPSERRAAR